MQQILLNLALIHLNKFVHEHSIDTGTKGTYCVKDGRGFSYKLVDAETGQKVFARVTFKKSAVPVYGWH